MGKFSKVTWTDRNVQYPRRGTISRVAGAGSVDDGDSIELTPTPGTITAAGQPTNAAVMQNIEDQVEEITNGTHNYATTTGGDTYAITFSTPFTAYNTGMIFNIKADTGNTGVATLNVDTIGAKAIKKFESSGKVDTATGDMITAGYYTLIYDGTDFILLNPNSINQSVVTAQGDILYASGANTIARLAKGTALQNIRMDASATIQEWYTGAKVVYGSYAGDNTDGRDVAVGITGKSFTIHSQTSNRIVFGVAGLNRSFLLTTGGNAESTSTYLNGTNLRVDNSTDVINASGVTYFYTILGE